MNAGQPGGPPARDPAGKGSLWAMGAPAQQGEWGAPECTQDGD